MTFVLYIEHGTSLSVIPVVASCCPLAELENTAAGRGRYPVHEGYLHVCGRIMATVARLASRCFCPQGSTTIGVGREAEPLPKDDRRSCPCRGKLPVAQALLYAPSHMFVGGGQFLPQFHSERRRCRGRIGQNTRPLSLRRGETHTHTPTHKRGQFTFTMAMPNDLGLGTGC